MIVPFFLTPKAEVISLPVSATVRQALEKMAAHTYTALPLVDKEGRYKGTLTEGDLLRLLWQNGTQEPSIFTRLRLSEIELRTENKPVGIGAGLPEILELLKTQNFVPVVDDEGTFIGIVRRREIIDLCAVLLGHKYGDSLDSSNLEMMSSIQEMLAGGSLNNSGRHRK